MRPRSRRADAPREGGGMQKTIDELEILFNKIESGEATEEERLDYDLGIGISCVKEEILRESIKERARELKAE